MKFGIQPDKVSFFFFFLNLNFYFFSERYKSLAPMYYRGAAAAIVTYDITNPVRIFFFYFFFNKKDSFSTAKNWVKELQRQGNTSIVIALAGNKSDLGETKRKVAPEEVQQFADENGLIFLETSAKTSENVREIFIAIAKRLPKENPLDEQDDPNPLLLKTPGSEPTTSSSGKCCQ